MENLKNGTPVRIKSTHPVAELQRKIAYIVDRFHAINGLYWVETKESRDRGLNLLRLVDEGSFFALQVTDASPCPPCAEGYCQDCKVAMDGWESTACGCETCVADRAELEVESAEFFNGLSDFFSSIDPENWVGWYVEEPLFDVGDLFDAYHPGCCGNPECFNLNEGRPEPVEVDASGKCPKCGAMTRVEVTR